MSNIIDLKKGLNIPISGVAALEAKKTIVPDTVAIKPTEGAVENADTKIALGVKAGSAMIP